MQKSKLDINFSRSAHGASLPSQDRIIYSVFIAPISYRAPSSLVTDSFANMINAVLVFNNNGQPRLTKFYTQLVSLAGASSIDPQLTLNTRTRKPSNPSSRRYTVWLHNDPQAHATSCPSHPSSPKAPAPRPPAPPTPPPKSPIAPTQRYHSL